MRGRAGAAGEARSWCAAAGGARAQLAELARRAAGPPSWVAGTPARQLRASRTSRASARSCRRAGVGVRFRSEPLYRSVWHGAASCPAGCRTWQARKPETPHDWTNRFGPRGWLPRGPPPPATATLSAPPWYSIGLGWGWGGRFRGGADTGTSLAYTRRPRRVREAGAGFKWVKGIFFGSGRYSVAGPPTGSAEGLIGSPCIGVGAGGLFHGAVVGGCRNPERWRGLTSGLRRGLGRSRRPTTLR